MANIQQITRDYLLRARTEGVAATTAAAQQLGAATDTLATKTETVTKSQVSAAAALDRLQRQLDTSYKSARQFEQAQRDLDRAQSQGLLSISRHAELLAKATQQYGQASAASRAFATVTSGVSGQLIALSAGAGPVGTFLSALGPWGLAAAVGIGAVSAAFNHMIAEAERVGDKANEIRKFAVVTGLTVEQIKGLTKTAGSLGVDSGDVTTAIERLTVGLEEARKGSGTLFDQVRVLNPELALELARSTSTAQGIDAYAKALKAATSETQRAALARAGLGKGGQDAGLVLIAVADTGGLDAAAAKTKTVTGLTGEWVKEVAHLRNENQQLEKEAANLYAGMYAKEVLERQNQFLRVQRDIAAEFVKTGKNPNAAGIVGGGFGFGAELDLTPAPTPKATGTLSEGARQAQADAVAYRALVDAYGLYNDGADKAARRSKELTEARDRELKGLQLLTNTERDRLGALGAAATIDEKRIQRINEINVALGEHKFATDKSTIADEKTSAARAIGAANLDAQIQRTGALNGILGVAATVQDQYRAKLQQIAKAQQEGAAANDNQISNAKRLALAQADGTFQLQAQIDATKVQTATLGLSIAKAEEFSLIQTKVNENLNAGRPALDGVTDSYRKLAAAAGAAKQAQEVANINQQIGRDRQTALLSPESVQIANQLKSIYPDIATALGSSEAAAMRFNNALKQSKDDATQFAQSFVKGLMDGKNISDALSNSLKSLSARLADRAIEDLLSGDFGKAAVAGISAAATYIASLFTGNSGQKLKDQIALIDKVSALQTRQIAATTDQSTLAGQLAAFDHQANIQRMMEARDGNKAIGELEKTLSDERLKIISDFDAQALKATQDAAAAQEAVMKAAQQRIQSAQDRLFNATNDPNTLEGQLAAFDRQAQADQLAERDAGGQAMLALEAAQAQERLNIIKGYNQKITDAATQAAQAQLDAQTKAAKQILDYLNGLNVGSASSLSPQGRLNAAQATYNTELGLAQGGNANALASITADAENLRKAAQDFYASGSGYQSTLTTIQAQLLALPAVQTSADPVIVALRDVQTAVLLANSSINSGTGTVSSALDLNHDGIVDQSEILAFIKSANEATRTNTANTSDAIGAGNALQASANSLQLTANAILNSQTSLLTAINMLSDRDVNAINGLGVLTASIASTHSSQFNTMISLLGAIASRPTGGGGTLWSWLGFEQGGMIPGYAGGGMIGNGTWNRDSVIARYAGGGDIALAGGEYVTRATSVNAATLPLLRYVNDNGHAPANDNGLDGRAIANLTRVSAAGSNAIVAALREEIGALREELAGRNAAARVAGNMRPRPGAPLAQKSA